MKRIFYLFCLLFIFHFWSNSQSPPGRIPATYSIAMQRTLVRGTANFIYVGSQGQLDMDSAMIFSCHNYNLGRLFPYNEEIAEESSPVSEKMINDGRITEVKKMLDNSQGKDRLMILFQLGIYYLFKPGNLPVDLDSARMYIQSAAVLTDEPTLSRWKKESQTLLGKYYFQAGNFPESQKYFAQVTAACRQSGDQKADLAMALENQASHLPFGNPDRLKYLNESYDLLQKSGLKEKQIDVYTLLVTEYFQTNITLAEKKLKELLVLMQQSGFKHQQYVYYTLSYLTDMNGDYSNSLYYAQEALNLLNATGDTILAPLFYMRIGTIYGHNERPDALEWFEKGIAGRRRETELFWYKSFISAVQILSFSKRSADALDLIEKITTEFPAKTAFDQMQLALTKAYCYAELRQTERAEKNYALFTSMAEKFPPEFIQSEMPESYYLVSRFYFIQKDYKKSRFYIEKGTALQGSRSFVHMQRNIYQMNYLLDSVSGNYQSALHNHVLYKIYSDSLFNISQRNRVNELITKYETTEKDQNIKLLKNEGLLQKATLQKSNLIRNITIAGLLVLSIVMGLMYNQYRLKQKANREVLDKNITLQHLVDEKEWLMKEIHHRVKNNLQTIVSLLESQSAYLRDDALLAIQDSQNRIYAMSLIHQKLYNADNVASINMSAYLPELINYLRDIFDTRQKIQFQLEIEPVELDVSQAVPVGLIINEAITNSIKYAFPERHPNNRILVRMERNDHDEINLTITDNGMGLPADWNKQKSSGLGLKLMKGLTGDIEGRFSMESNNGTIIRIQFIANKPLNKTEEFGIGISEISPYPV